MNILLTLLITSNIFIFNTINLTNTLNRYIKKGMYKESDKELKKNGYKTIEDIFKITSELYYKLNTKEFVETIKIDINITLETFDYCKDRKLGLKNNRIELNVDTSSLSLCSVSELPQMIIKYQEFYGERILKLKGKMFHYILIRFYSNNDKIKRKSKLEVFIDSKTGEVLLFSKVDTMMSD